MKINDMLIVNFARYPSSAPEEEVEETVAQGLISSRVRGGLFLLA